MMGRARHFYGELKCHIAVMRRLINPIQKRRAFVGSAQDRRHDRTRNFSNNGFPALGFGIKPQMASGHPRFAPDAPTDNDGSRLTA